MTETQLIIIYLAGTMIAFFSAGLTQDRDEGTIFVACVLWPFGLALLFLASLGAPLYLLYNLGRTLRKHTL